MGDRLRIDLGVVRDTATRLGSIGTSLEGAESAADELAGMIPHRGLAGCVEKFGKNWDRARTELIGKLEDLQGAATTVADTFEEADSEMAATVRGE
ncbi:hypothetical protein [Isoptericola variabilis]|uniref:Excreted virulence factor EspC, type VII ESX diderm n=1 Tax=Isoptericola variabilis (strain 225) TaxID=743718 RepID=F6FVP9_ISOV2|nr:hypothetical protein [Isoptericola variabilis]AEG45550.1 hypothetical protein Isova_2864 [Isoptericola variabilis 225]TWH25846.1 hypothetical protein L600_000900000960 [Isoptericola variabilis J7]